MDQTGQLINAADRPEWSELIDLAGARLGGKALACSDDFFAEMDNLLKPEPAVFIPGKFTTRGKWMDGWESRRKRVPGHDWCIIQLGRPGAITGVNIDTAHFNGNQPEFCTVEGTELPTPKGAGKPTASIAQRALAKAHWQEIIPRTPMRPSSEHFIRASSHALGKRFTHIRLNVFPDGGVARLRVHGSVIADWASLAKSKKPIDLACAANGGLVVAANNMHFGSRHNLIMPDRAKNMGDGWETRRKRNLTWIDGQPVEHDWAIVRLGHRGAISKIEVDTNHFKGNFPESCLIEVCDAASHDPRAFDPESAVWTPLLARTKLKASHRHTYSKELHRAALNQPCTHARLSIFPDGGISRLRIWGRPTL